MHKSDGVGSTMRYALKRMVPASTRHRIAIHASMAQRSRAQTAGECPLRPTTFNAAEHALQACSK